MKTITVTEENAGKRADVVATEALPTLSRAYVHHLMADSRITINKEKSKAGYKLRVGDKLYIDFDESEIEQIASIDLPILFENDDVLIINKPDGVISHSRGKYWNEPSVASFVREKTGLDGDRAGIVHRLDRATSGVMICAKNQKAMSWLQKQFSTRAVKKTYMAIVDGHIKPPEAIIDMPIERNPKAPATFRVGSNGKPSITKYKVTASSQKYDLVELMPTTGRTHQLRVHLRKLGHPIAGDRLYEGSKQDRLMLHATALEITLPDGNSALFSAPLPTSFNILLEHDK
jgi:23S rRNA pseudouridine1911/1915/1917 synthase